MIYLKNNNEIANIRESCRMLAALLDTLNDKIKEGMSTKDIDVFCHDWIIKRNAKPECLGFEGFPASVCSSVNDVIIHGIPSAKTVLKEGDIVSIDLCINYKGYISDSARTYMIGKVNEKTAKLVKVTEECLYKGIEAASQPKARIMDIGYAVDSHARKNGFSVIHEYCGHGVGLQMHEDPEIPNYVCHYLPNPRIRQGMVFAIEPMVNMGKRDILDNDPDGWTVRTADGLPAAHFEHTVAITDNGLEILTQL